MNNETNTATIAPVAAPAPGVAAANRALEEALRQNGGSSVISIDLSASIAQDTSRLEQLEAERQTVLKRMEEAKAKAAAQEEEVRQARIDAISDQLKGLPWEDLKMVFMGLRTQLSVLKKNGGASTGGRRGVPSNRRVVRVGGIPVRKLSTNKAPHGTAIRVSQEDHAKIIALKKSGMKTAEIQRQTGFTRQTLYRHFEKAGISVNGK